MCNNFVPLVVVNTKIFPCMNSRGYSKEEFPYCSPSAICPSLSPAVIQAISFPRRMHFSTLSTGITSFAPLYKAVAIVEVARKISITTTTQSRTLYKCNKAGDKDVYKVGLAILDLYVK